MKIIRLLAALSLTAGTLLGQSLDRRALGTNSFYTTIVNAQNPNGGGVDSKIWTNQSGLYRYQPGTGPVVTGSRGPSFTLRGDGSTFVGTNVFQDVAANEAGLFFPHAISMTDSNEPNTIHADWFAIDNQLYGVYGGVAITAQQAGSALINISSDTGPLDSLIGLNATPGADYIKLNDNGTDRFVASGSATNVIQANAVGQNWLFIGQTNSEPTIRVRADGSIFTGRHVADDVNINNFTHIYTPYSTSMVDSNEPALMSAYWNVIDSEEYGFYSTMGMDIFGDKDDPYSKIVLNAEGTNGVDSFLAFNVRPNAPGTIAIRLKNGTERFNLGYDGDLDLIKSVTYSWPTAYGGANTVLTMPAADGILVWSNIAALVTNNQILPGSGIGPGTNTYLSMFNSTGTNVINSPLKSPFTNSLEAFLLPNGGTFTNGATTNRMYSMFAHANTNSYLEFVSAPPFTSQEAHIRHNTTGFTSQRLALNLNDTMLIEPGDNQQGGHGAYYVTPKVNQAGGLIGLHGTSSSHWYGYNSGAAGFVVYDQTATKAEVNLGAGDGFGVSNTDINVIHGATAYIKILNTGAGEQGINLGVTQLMGGGAINVHNSFLMFQPNGVCQLGTNNVNGAATPQTNRLQGILASGTDRPGGRIGLAGGQSTGTGANGAVDILTSEKASGTSSTVNTLYTRTRVAPDPVTLTTNSATIVFNVTIPTADRMVGGEVTATTKITDGTDQATVKERFAFTAIRKGSTVTTSISASAPMASLATGAAVLTTTWSAVANAQSVDIKCNAVTAGILSTNSTTRWRVELDSDAIPIITP